MPCYITRTGSFLPGRVVSNDGITRCLGMLPGEEEVARRVLAMNGIRGRHYVGGPEAGSARDVYDLGVEACRVCLGGEEAGVGYLSAGTTYTPLAAPGYSSILHARLADAGLLNRSVEISSHGGVCSSSSSAFVAAARAVASGEHREAVCVGAEHASAVLHADVIRPIDDRAEHADVRRSRWFMSVFLRHMLSDGAGAVLLSDVRARSGLSFRVDWTFSASHAHDTELCMWLDAESGLLSQDVRVLMKYLFPRAGRSLSAALARHNDRLERFHVILPHMSSFFFQKKMERVVADHCDDPRRPTPYWTNLAEVGNTGAASIFIMLDGYARSGAVGNGDRLLLFVPESGRFNFVFVALTAVTS